MAAASAPSLQFTPEFHKSYLDFRRYPSNAILKCDYPDVLESQKSRLDSAAEDLLTDPTNPAHTPRNPNEPKIRVTFRDWDSSNQQFSRRNVYDEDELRSWLGDVTPAAATSLIDLKKADPKCRFVFLYGETSRSRLKLSRGMLCRLFTHHQVMHQYLQFISVFGVGSGSNSMAFSGKDVRFSGFQVQNAACGKMMAVHDLGRSERRFQMCYNLKTVAEISKGSWSIRQAAFHHQFDIETGNALWISTKGHLDDIKKRVEFLTGSSGKPEDRSFGDVFECFRSSLAVHLMYCQWSTEGWRWYIEYLERKIEKESLEAVTAPQTAASGAPMYSSETLQSLQSDTDKANEAIMIIESNLDIMTRLQKFYESLLVNRNFVEALPTPSSASLTAGQANAAPTADPRVSEVVTSFVMQLESMAGEMSMHVSRARLLVTIARDRNTLILQHMQNQSTEKMHLLTLLSYKEAVVMRIITVVTLLFLPATFVSTFFSTNVVQYQNVEGNESFSHLAMMRWLQVTVPLTILTLGFGLLAYKYAKVKSDRELLPYHSEKMV